MSVIDTDYRHLKSTQTRQRVAFNLGDIHRFECLRQKIKKESKKAGKLISPELIH